MPVRRAARAPQSAFVPMNASRPAKARIPIGDQRSLPLIGRLWREFVRPYIPWLLGAVVASAVVAAATAASAWLLDPVVNKVFVERRSEEHTSELQSLMRISYAVFCLKKTKKE